MSQPIQETTSVYFNNIIRKNVKPITIVDMDEEAVDTFNRAIDSAFPDNKEEVRRRLKYVMPYIFQNIDWEEYKTPLEGWQLRYYYQRDRFLEKTHLKWESFISHEPMQTAIGRLGLEPEAVFEFILLLCYYFGLRADLRYSCVEEFQNIMDELENNPAAEVIMDVKVGKRHFKISNSGFLRLLLGKINIKEADLQSFSDDFTQGRTREKIRAIDYFMVKTLLDYLPIDKTLRRGGRFSQMERNFGLSVLNLCGRLPDIDRNGVCSQENNATFDKLMRDFRDVPIPFAMELFL